jgi:predicted transcriptional regulator
MTTANLSRKREFKVALARLGLTAKSFAAEQGVTQSHLYAVLSDGRPSARLTAAIDALIARSCRPSRKAA